MERTRKPTAAGILCIVAGFLILAIPVAFFGSIGVRHSPGPGDDPGMALFMVIFVCIPLITLGTVAVVGGIYALRRQIWALALAGSVCALPVGLILGILAIIFIVRGRREFMAHTPAEGTSPKSRRITALFAFFLGIFGAHRFYVGRIRTAIVMLLLSIVSWGELFLHFVGYGFFVPVWFIMAVGAWAFIDFIVAVTGNMTDKEGRLVQKW